MNEKQIASLLFNLNIAFDALIVNKLRSFLTALGIIFGVAAVISMLAIGNGAQQEILEQIRLVGVNNIVLKAVSKTNDEEESANSSGKKLQKKYSPGLRLSDAESIRKMSHVVALVSPEIELERKVMYRGILKETHLIGVLPDYFKLTNWNLLLGNMFSPMQLENSDPVCILGKTMQTELFKNENPIGKKVKCGTIWLTVIGVLEERNISKTDMEKLGIRNLNKDVYIPVKTLLLRFKNRSLVTKSMIERNAERDEEGPKSNHSDSRNYHQLDKLVIQVKSSEYLNSCTEVVSRMIKRRHNDVTDFELSVPEFLLKQQQRTREIFNVVLGAIAGISLLVGGIGIMNIMLASVMERIREIGIRLALGATKNDIISQFLFEAVLLSLSGGITGILLGTFLSRLISGLADIATIISPFSVIISFVVAAGVGVVFGITPARRAAMQDPIVALRYE